MGRPKKNNVEWSGMPTDEAEKKEIKASLMSIQLNLTEIDSQKQSIEEVFSDLHEKYGIPKRVFNFLAKAMFLGNQEEIFGKNEEIKEAWDELEKIDIE